LHYKTWVGPGVLPELVRRYIIRFPLTIRGAEPANTLAALDIWLAKASAHLNVRIDAKKGRAKNPLKDRKLVWDEFKKLLGDKQ